MKHEVHHTHHFPQLDPTYYLSLYLCWLLSLPLPPVEQPKEEKKDEV